MTRRWRGPAPFVRGPGAPRGGHGSYYCRRFIGWLLASHAAVAFSSARTHAQLHTAMETRHSIGEAIGIVMERCGLDEEQAFALLRRSSQDRNIKLREIVRTVTETGEIPGAASAGPARPGS